MAHHTCGIAQNRNMESSCRSDMYFKQSSACLKASVTISFRHSTAFEEAFSSFRS